MMWYFLFFFVSGFCSILYELIWLRLAMAQFSVTTAFVSIVLSTFMAGMGIGSIGAGAWIRRHGEKIWFHPLRLYALTELLIGVSALVVPMELAWGHRVFGAAAAHSTLSSAMSYLISGVWMALTLVPWCACMGATIPVGMFAIRSDARYESRRSFSFLYLANVLGAVAGAILPLLFIELYGFHGTLRVGAMLNATIAASALVVSISSRGRTVRKDSQSARAVLANLEQGKSIVVLLFMTGLVTMGMEVVWIRLYTPYLGTFVYSFATILASYLLATFVGSQAYRVWSRGHERESRIAWISLGLLGVLPLLMSDSRNPHNTYPSRHAGCNANLGCNRIFHTHAGGSLVGRRSGPRGPRLCGQRRRVYRWTAGLRLHPAAAGRRAPLHASVRPALACDGGSEPQHAGDELGTARGHRPDLVGDERDFLSFLPGITRRTSSNARFCATAPPPSSPPGSPTSRGQGRGRAC